MYYIMEGTEETKKSKVFIALQNNKTGMMETHPARD